MLLERDDELSVLRTFSAAAAQGHEGALLLEGSPSPVLQVAEIIVDTHHERWDGTGYPNGLSGVEIPLEGRIAAVCDVFDALTHQRPYKEAWSVERACGEIERLRGTHFDPEVADAIPA
jgi:putative two-component system response regulator